MWHPHSTVVFLIIAFTHTVMHCNKVRQGSSTHTHHHLHVDTHMRTYVLAHASNWSLYCNRTFWAPDLKTIPSHVFSELSSLISLCVSPTCYLHLSWHAVTALDSHRSLFSTKYSPLLPLELRLSTSIQNLLGRIHDKVWCLLLYKNNSIPEVGTRAAFKRKNGLASKAASCRGWNSAIFDQICTKFS